MILNFISLKEQAPEENGIYIVWLKDGSQKAAVYYANEDGDGWYNYVDDTRELIFEDFSQDKIEAWSEIPLHLEESFTKNDNDEMLSILYSITEEQRTALMKFIKCFGNNHM